MPDIDLATVIFAVVAIVVVFKLRSVLGTRNDGQRPTGLVAPLSRAPGPASPPAPLEPAGALPASAPVATAERWEGYAAPEAFDGLDAIAAADRGLEPQAFLSGARAAYDMVIQAFAAGDRPALQGLMAPEAFANFDAAIRARAAAGHTMTTTVVSIDDAKIAAAQLIGTMAQIGVRFTSKLATVVRDKAGKVVEGSATEVADHTDVWTFVRDIRSRDPNWRLTETQSDR